MVTEPLPQDPQPGELQGRFEGRKAFQQIVRDALAQAAREGWREILICDTNFEDWPLNERAVSDALQAWSRTGRKFTMLARRYDTVQQVHHRFVTWRRTWAHIIECRACPSAEASDFPSAICSPGWVMERLDPVRSVGVMGAEPVRRVALRERLEEWLLKSSPAFPASTLGL